MTNYAQRWRAPGRWHWNYSRPARRLSVQRRNVRDRRITGPALTGRTTSGTRGCPIPGAIGGVSAVTATSPGSQKIQIHPHFDIEITTFGLVPDFVGAGLGGHALALAAAAAWNVKDAGCQEVRRVWLHTSTLDYPHALPNYLRRGFRPCLFGIAANSPDLSTAPCRLHPGGPTCRNYREERRPNSRRFLIGT